MSLKLTENLSEQAEQFEQEFLINRDTDLRKAAQILAREQNRYPIFIGEFGSGRTTFLRQLAAHLLEDESLSRLQLLRINLDGLQLQSGKLFASRLLAVVKAAAKCPKPTVLFFDELEPLCQRKGEAWRMVLRAVRFAMQSKLAGCGLLCSSEIFHREIKADPILSTAASAVHLQSAEEQEVVVLLAQQTNLLDADSLKRISHYAQRFIKNLSMPASAINLLDKLMAVYPQANTVSNEQIEQVLTQWYGVEVIQAAAFNLKRLSQLKNELSKVVFGQDAVLQQLQTRLPVYAMGLDQRVKIPLLIFEGEAGSGRAALAEKLNAFLYGKHSQLQTISLAGAQSEMVFQELAQQSGERVILFAQTELAPASLLLAIVNVAKSGKLDERMILKDCLFVFCYEKNLAAQLPMLTFSQSLPVKQQEPIKEKVAAENSLLQLVVDDMPEAVDVEPMPAVSFLQSQEQEGLPDEFLKIAEVFQFAVVELDAIEQGLQQALTEMLEQVQTAQGVCVTVDVNFVKQFVEQFNLFGASLEQAESQLRAALLPVVGEWLLTRSENQAGCQLVWQSNKLCCV